MSGYTGSDDELFDTDYFESNLETYFMIKNVEVMKDDIVQLKGSAHKGDILGMLPDEETVYVNWDNCKCRTLEKMKDIVWIKTIHEKPAKVWRRTDGCNNFS